MNLIISEVVPMFEPETIIVESPVDVNPPRESAIKLK